jgi:tetraacyldisaccharide-1-P 4'-kinase
MKVMVVDFDDTLVHTECRTQVRKPDGRVLAISPAEYVGYTLEPGDVFDFSEFETLRRPRPVRCMVRAVRRAVALGHAVVVCTARGNPQPVFEFLRMQGMAGVEVIALGSGAPAHKADAVRGLMQGATKVSFRDDSPKNVAAVAGLGVKARLFTAA